jgi:hypothetical protein
LNSGLHPYLAGSLPLEPLCQPANKFLLCCEHRSFDLLSGVGTCVSLGAEQHTGTCLLHFCWSLAWNFGCLVGAWTQQLVPGTAVRMFTVCCCLLTLQRGTLRDRENMRTLVSETGTAGVCANEFLSASSWI